MSLKKLEKEETKMVKLAKSIDLTKPQLTWRYLLLLFVVIVVLVLTVGLAIWVSGKLKTAVAGPAGSKRRIEERRI